MSFDADRLMKLLPAVYRARDDRKNELRALLAVIAEQIGVLEEDLAQLYDDQFIETCAAWVIPYIGDLLGNRPLYDGGGDADAEPREVFPDLAGPRFVPRVALRGRADVAKTIFYRKRKATLPMLEALASDVTGWTARVVEFFELLRWNQCVRNHLRLFSHGQPDLRSNEPLERIGGPFDTITHTIDVRPVSQVDGWYEMRNIGFFLWRLRSYELDDADARLDSGFRYRANRLGLDAPLFTREKRNDFVGVTELQVPGPIRPTFFLEDLRRFNALPAPLPGASDIYGLPDEPLPDLKRSISIFVDGVFIKPELICAANLATWNQPAGFKVAVDVRNGRIALGDKYANGAAVLISFHYGFSADLGGGTYPRSGWLVKQNPADPDDQIAVKKGTAVDTLAKALAQWVTGGRKNTVITIGDNRTYDETASTLVLDPPDKKRIVIQADTHCWPHVILNKPIDITCGEDATATLSGLLIEGQLVVRQLSGRLRLLHTTVAPVAGKPSLSTTPAVMNKTKVDTFRAEIAFSILGAIQLPPNGRGVAIFDSIVDGAITGYKANTPGPALRIERSTVFGRVFVRELPLATEAIFNDVIIVVRRQQGCARFSFIPRGSRTPRPYRCQPDLEIRTRDELEKARLGRDLTPAELKAIADVVYAFLEPSFTSVRYGDPGYAQLHLHAPPQITRGAQDGSEMGAFCHLKQPQREGNLRLRLGEYLPFGLVPGFIYVT
jgi:hypothetical protein